MDPELGGSCSRFQEEVSCILMSAEEQRPSWARFHAAQELGHLVLHRRFPTGPFADDQAERFARAFLLPARVFAQEVWAPNIDALLTLKKDWRCPISAMVARCGEVGVFDADQVRRAMVNLGRRGWKTAEPRESAALPEEPRLLARSLRLVIDDSLKTPHSVLAEIGLHASDIEALTGLPAGYFAACERTPPSVLRLRRSDPGAGARLA
jgi:Zn-dependent peptidase ImmA (M78 family)